MERKFVHSTNNQRCLLPHQPTECLPDYLLDSMIQVRIILWDGRRGCDIYQVSSRLSQRALKMEQRLKHRVSERNGFVPLFLKGENSAQT